MVKMILKPTKPASRGRRRSASRSRSKKTGKKSYYKRIKESARPYLNCNCTGGVYATGRSRSRDRRRTRLSLPVPDSLKRMGIKPYINCSCTGGVYATPRSKKFDFDVVQCKKHSKKKVCRQPRKRRSQPRKRRTTNRRSQPRKRRSQRSRSRSKGMKDLDLYTSKEADKFIKKENKRRRRNSRKSRKLDKKMRKSRRKSLRKSRRTSRRKSRRNSRMNYNINGDGDGPGAGGGRPEDVRAQAPGETCKQLLEKYNNKILDRARELILGVQTCASSFCRARDTALNDASESSARAVEYTKIADALVAKLDSMEDHESTEAASVEAMALQAQERGAYAREDAAAAEKRADRNSIDYHEYCNRISNTLFGATSGEGAGALTAQSLCSLKPGGDVERVIPLFEDKLKNIMCERFVYYYKGTDGGGVDVGEYWQLKNGTTITHHAGNDFADDLFLHILKLDNII